MMKKFSSHIQKFDGYPPVSPFDKVDFDAHTYINAEGLLCI